MIRLADRQRWSAGTYSFTWADTTTNCTAATVTLATSMATTSSCTEQVAAVMPWRQLTEVSLKVRTWPQAVAIFDPPLDFSRSPRIEPGADRVAEALLRRHLSPVQLDQLQAQGFFDVERPGRTYRIHRGRSINIQVLEAGRAIERRASTQERRCRTLTPCSRKS